MTSNKLLPQTALGHKVMAMFRAPLAAAVQWSSPTPSRPSAEGAVGRVYSSAGQHTTGGRPGAPAAYACGAAQNLQAAPPSAAGTGDGAKLGTGCGDGAGDGAVAEGSEEDRGEGELLSEPSADLATTGTALKGGNVKGVFDLLRFGG